MKAEKERSEELEDENSKMKKKLKDARKEVEDEVAAKDEVSILTFDCLFVTLLFQNSLCLPSISLCDEYSGENNSSDNYLRLPVELHQFFPTLLPVVCVDVEISCHCFFANTIFSVPFPSCRNLSLPLPPSTVSLMIQNFISL